MTSITYPFTEKQVRALKVGDAVSITGRIYTGRDKFHKYFAEGGKLPVDFKDGAIYHCGPVVVRMKNEELRMKNGAEQGARSVPDRADESAWQVVAAGPTTSVRENAYEPAFIAKSGVRLVIGKGGMDDGVLKAMRKHGAVYIQAVGGAAAISAAAVKKVAGVSLLDEFGAAEAVWHFDVVDFRGVVAMDAHGNSLFERVRRDSVAQLRELAGLS